jgi:hypothetical protein
MVFHPLRGLAIAVSLAAGLGFLTAAPAMAVCYGPQQQLPPATLTDFAKSPADILKLNNAELISRVRDLVASSPQALQLIQSILSSASPSQVSAIGTGLGQAALICVRTDQAFSTEIQNAVAGIGNANLTLAFSAVLGDQPIGAVGGAGGAGGVSGGAGGGQNSPTTGSGFGGFFGSSQTFASSFTKNTGTNYFTSSGATAGPGAPSTTTTITTVNSVSPTH